ncbi:hypothetical protein DTO013E5_7179 [Penicillium roqueforti]|uniref:uncharacterized protein n=1 Tax=Penicillium roqueforti TaxID=5082 RepID=UPI00190C8858|nr:uncharacterized protein LCP9604111_7589 [Penicillium roqueforti]KAF9243670.1 hypothetical protein LCP9604111_7589 [Penicillium roqueforti]KAI1832334.1 hypothetical protein CBS147337_7014 [Penicillium roqueforti]KAI2671086.1 hypothetical protein CBS147355_8943 [Penicillium roqueforti]KAI2673190.1 hypothetical protein LCP963914a_9184 [Penicillium roqueforti]KAI2699074.1 hypothetical protein CBS147372_6321 [Penicillium roqueforti]
MPILSITLRQRNGCPQLWSVPHTVDRHVRTTDYNGNFQYQLNIIFQIPRSTPLCRCLLHTETEYFVNFFCRVGPLSCRFYEGASGLA